MHPVMEGGRSPRPVPQNGDDDDGVVALGGVGGYVEARLPAAGGRVVRELLDPAARHQRHYLPGVGGRVRLDQGVAHADEQPVGLLLQFSLPLGRLRRLL